MRIPATQFSDGTLVHILNRGNNRQTIFHADEDYHWFIQKAAMLFNRYELKDQVLNFL